MAELLELFDDVARALDDVGACWWAEAGTLVGALRHGGALPWTDDEDIGFLPGGFSLPNLAAACKAYAITLQPSRGGAYLQAGRQAPGEPLSAAHVDLFPYEWDGEHYRNADARFAREDPHSAHAHCNTRYGRDELLPLAAAPWYGGSVPVPRAAGAALDRALGARWRDEAVVRGPGGSTAPVVARFALGAADRAPA